MAPTAPLAGRPPFATDKPDSYYTNNTSSQPRPQPRPSPQANRTSAYDVYDNYLDGNQPPSRESGVEGLGMGFMNASMDDDSDDEDDDIRARVPPSPSKNAALAAAVTGNKSKGMQLAPERFETPPPQYPKQQQPPQPQQPQMRQTSPAPIAAPRPGYAAPIAALNQMQNTVTRPPLAAHPAGRGPPSDLRINAAPYGSAPSPTTSPHPLQAPVTPITPVFARPARESNVSFSDTKNLIMRGEGEETLIPRGRGKGEQFWRRFSMVAKDPSEKGPSEWLKKNQSGSHRHVRYVWLIGIVLIICAAGGIGLGVYMSEKASAHYRPDTIGGSAEDGGTALSSSTTSSAKSAKGAVKTASDTDTSVSIGHVSPTNTVARRDPDPTPQITAVAAHAARANRHTARHGHDFAL